MSYSLHELLWVYLAKDCLPLDYEKTWKEKFKKIRESCKSELHQKIEKPNCKKYCNFFFKIGFALPLTRGVKYPGSSGSGLDLKKFIK